MTSASSRPPWLLPCNFHGTVAPGWLDDEPELCERVVQFRRLAIDAFGKGSRIARVPGDAPPHVWMVDTGGFQGMPDEWCVEGLTAFVGMATEELPGASPRLIATPLVGAGLGGRAYDKGTLLPTVLETFAARPTRGRVGRPRLGSAVDQAGRLLESFGSSALERARRRRG